MAHLTDHLSLTLQQHREALTTAIQPIESAPHRRTYAQVLLNRLLLLHGFQRSGWLGNRDDWYVQNLLGQSQKSRARSLLPPHLKAAAVSGLGSAGRERPLALHRFGALPYLGSALSSP
ncbi:MAG: hypothetical protein HC812_16230, partial [Leptolyngbya sp. RL_3_1]|nr:hypothetical protein [Leptolyngbya sp. RL_3_1]